MLKKKKESPKIKEIQKRINSLSKSKLCRSFFRSKGWIRKINMWSSFSQFWCINIKKNSWLYFNLSWCKFIFWQIRNSSKSKKDYCSILIDRYSKTKSINKNSKYLVRNKSSRSFKKIRCKLQYDFNFQ